MAVLSVGDAGQDVFTYDETLGGPMSLVGEGNIGDVFAIVAGSVVRPQAIGGGGVGDVSRQGSTIDNRLARWHTVNALIQVSALSVNDSGDLSGVNDLSLIGLLTAGTDPIVLTTVAGLIRHEAIDPDIAGSGLSVADGIISVDSHAPAAHTIASHSDTTATGAQLNTLVGGGSTNLHSHAIPAHTIVSHSDTGATGAQLDSLTNNSIVNTLHRHSELVASDGSPDPALSVDAAGNVGIGTASPTAQLEVFEDDNLNGLGKFAAIISDNSNDGLSGGLLVSSFLPRLVLNDESGGADWFDFRISTNKLIVGNGEKTDLFTRVTDNLFVIQANGNVGIGVIDPDVKLEVAGDITATGGTIIAGVAASQVGVVSLNRGSGGNQPAYLALVSRNGTVWLVFVEDDGTVKITSKVPVNNADGDPVGEQVD